MTLIEVNMSDIKLTAQEEALAVLEQAYAYYEPAEVTEAAAEEEFEEYFEYVRAA